MILLIKSLIAYM
jgi:hypothetical protein